jgi:hypothetical protein
VFHNRTRIERRWSEGATVTGDWPMS